MTLSVTYSSLNTLNGTSFIAGSNYTFKFNILDQSGSAIDLSTATCTWRMSPFGNDYTILQKTGSVIATNTFVVLLTSADTAGLSGKFTHQPTITFSDGTVFIPAQGTITILKGIGNA